MTAALYIFLMGMLYIIAVVLIARVAGFNNLDEE